MWQLPAVTKPGDRWKISHFSSLILSANEKNGRFLKSWGFPIAGGFLLGTINKWIINGDSPKWLRKPPKSPNLHRWSSLVISVLPPRHTSPCRCFGRWSQFLDLIELGDPQHLVGTQKNGVWKRTKHGWIRMDKYKLDDLLDDVSLSYWINLDL